MKRISSTMEIDLLKHTLNEALTLVFNCKGFVDARNNSRVHF